MILIQFVGPDKILEVSGDLVIGWRKIGNLHCVDWQCQFADWAHLHAIIRNRGYEDCVLSPAEVFTFYTNGGF